ncbi:MAG: hypothetical protein R3F08_05040 [Dokdonella sp.]
MVDGGCYGATQGPRLETRAEIARRDGCDLVGMTGMPGLRWPANSGSNTCLALVANWAAGCNDESISLEEIFANLEHTTARVMPLITRLLASPE